MRKKPVGICTTCGIYTFAPQRIDTRCGWKRDGFECSGVIRSALGPSQWAECDYCSGTGRIGVIACGDCQESGWVYIRQQQSAELRS